MSAARRALEGGRRPGTILPEPKTSPPSRRLGGPLAARCGAPGRTFAERTLDVESQWLPPLLVRAASATNPAEFVNARLAPERTPLLLGNKLGFTSDLSRREC